jgi:DNA-directed RNA polymerase subunit RPC12/RpoP
MPRSNRDAYAKAIDKVREQHASSIPSAQMPVECPKCGTKQMLTDSPGKRVCIRCGFEFQRQIQKT